MALRQAGRAAIENAVNSRRGFKHGNIRGETFSEGWQVSTGRLPSEHVKTLREIETTVFVIFSWATPIAWYSNGSWCVPEVIYSRLTTNHQNVVRAAIR